MPAQLCGVCLSIPAWFWSPAIDKEGFPFGPRVQLKPFKYLQQSALNGCQLCDVLVSSAQVGFLSDRILESVTVTLSRTTIDSHQGMCLAVDADDISRTTFYRVPKPWDTFAPQGLDEDIDNFWIMRTWIEECRFNHAGCNNSSEKFLPTRLLDVRAFGSGNDIKLVSLLSDDHGNEGSSSRYCTLSHCWGSPDKRPVITTKENLHERRNRIAYADLPKTFADAVHITRMLGERYLWIDSLCIVQNDEADWVREAALMADVYSQSHCTLAALSSKNSSEGCCIVPNIQKSKGQFVEFDSEDDYLGRYRVRVFRKEPEAWHTEYGDDPYRRAGYGNKDCPLRSRAWTLQERALSMRSISFGKTQLIWECKELRATAQLPWHHKVPEDDFEMTPIRNSLKETLDRNGSAYLRDAWYEIVEDYTFRSLTQESDKLVALSGLAKTWQHKFAGGTYLSGIWSTHLPAALLWRITSSNTQRPSSYIAPTWSWASVKGEISYDSQRFRMHSGWEKDLRQYDFGNLQVREFHTQPKYIDVYGAIKNAYLIISGALLAEIQLEPTRRRIQGMISHSNGEVLTKDGVTVGLLYADTPNEIDGVRMLHLLKVRRDLSNTQDFILPRYIDEANELYEPEEENESNLMIALVLERVSENEGWYKRVGLARWTQDYIFKNSQPSSIVLI